MNVLKALRFGVRALLLSVFGGALGAAACASTCAPIACIPSVSIALDHSLSADGTYEFTIAADGTEMTCTATIPSKSAPRCTDERAFVFQSGDGSLTGVSVDGDLKALDVALTRDAVPLGEASFSLKYEDLPVGGVGCGTCPLAQEILTVTDIGELDAGADSGPGR